MTRLVGWTIEGGADMNGTSFKRAVALTVAAAGLTFGLPGSATAATAEPEGGTRADRPGYPCRTYMFCAWDDLGPDPTRRVFAMDGAIHCGWRWNMPEGDRARNTISSINNSTTGTWVLRDGVQVVWTADENSWGRLPVAAQNNVDNVMFICT